MADKTNIVDFASRSESETSSTAPMDCINDSVCLINHAIGIADMMTVVDTESLADGTIHKVGYALLDVLERAYERLKEARGGGHG